MADLPIYSQTQVRIATTTTDFVDVVKKTGAKLLVEDAGLVVGSTGLTIANLVSGDVRAGHALQVADPSTSTPATQSGVASIYASSGDVLRVKFGSGNIFVLNSTSGSGSGGATSVIGSAAAPSTDGWFDISLSGLSNYAKVEILGFGITCSTSDTTPQMRLKVGGSPSTGPYRYQMWSRRHDSNAQENASGADGLVDLSEDGNSHQWTNAANSWGNLEIHLFNAGATEYTGITFHNVHSRGGSMLRTAGGGHLESASVVNGVRIFPDKGAFQAGTVTVIGFNKST